MPCCVPLCPSNALKVSAFGVPKNETLKLEWERVLGVSFKPNSKVCRRHFREEDIIDTWESGQGFSKYTIDLKRPSLQKGAVPIRSASSISKVQVSEDSKSYNDIDTVSKKGISSVSKSSKVSTISTDHCYLDDDYKSGSDTTNKAISTINTSVSGRIASPLNDINPPKRIKVYIIYNTYLLKLISYHTYSINYIISENLKLHKYLVFLQIISENLLHLIMYIIITK